ncbi:hypothetical protein BDV06DRAFT_227050 [Aspergillus oleicola]
MTRRHRFNLFRRHREDDELDLSGLRITPELIETVNHIYKDILGNPKSHTVPSFMKEKSKDGRWDAKTAEKFAFLYFNEDPKRKQQIDDEVTPSCVKAVSAAPKGTMFEMAVFMQTVMDEVKGYIASHKPGLQTKECFEIFSRYAVLLNYQEIMGEKPCDFYDLGLEEFRH